MTRTYFLAGKNVLIFLNTIDWLLIFGSLLEEYKKDKLKCCIKIDQCKSKSPQQRPKVIKEREMIFQSSMPIKWWKNKNKNKKANIITSEKKVSGYTSGKQNQKYTKIILPILYVILTRRRFIVGILSGLLYGCYQKLS